MTEDKSRSGIKIEMWCRSDLTPKDIENFWDQNISMDDWDYLILVPREEMKMDSDGTWWPTYPLERLLNGSCSNDWHTCVFRGKEYGIGVAYHS